MQKQTILLFLCVVLLLGNIKAQKAKVYEEEISFATFPFFDPNPVAEVGRIYPYFRFDAYTNKSIQQKWKMVVLENNYVKIFVCPEVGGKVWGAIEKLSGKEFLYFNHVAKFRDVPMRGAWTSGGLEYNFGGIGYVQSLNALKQYEKTIAFLENYQIMPFEGSSGARDLYREICIRIAYSSLEKGKTKKAINYAEKAKKWPANLGVGRPYDVDKRLENYLLYSAFQQKKDETNVCKYATLLIDYQHPEYRQENSNLFLQLEVLLQNNQKEKADNLLKKYRIKYPENAYLKWVEAKVGNEARADELAKQIGGQSDVLMAYDTKFKDSGFQLLLDFLEQK